MRLFEFPAKRLVLAMAACFMVNGCTSTGQFSSEDAFSPLQSAVKATSVMEKGLSSSRLDHIAIELDRVLESARTAKSEKAKQSPALLVDAIAHAMGHDQKKIKPAVEQIRKSAALHDVPPTLLAALIHRESGFRHGVVSRSGAIGLSQILPKVWAKECAGLRTMPGNVDCGAKVLRHYYEDGGSWEKALAYYNVGPGAYQRSARSRATGSSFARQVMQGKGKIELRLAQMNKKSPQ